MKRSDSGVVVVIIVMIAFVVIFMMSALRKTAKDQHDTAQASDLNVAITNLITEDYMIYYLGTPPQELINSDIKMTVLSQDQLTSDLLPVYAHSFTFTEYDEDGNLVNQETPRDYARFMLIYVDSSIELSDIHLDLLHNCAVDNHVPIILEGKTNIELFRNKLILPVHIYEDSDTMMFTPWDSEDHVIPSSDLGTKGIGFATDLLNIMKQITVDQTQYYIDAAATAPTMTASEETTETAAETEETEPVETTLNSFESMVSEYLSTYERDSEEE